MTLMMSAILCDAALMPFIVSTTWPTTSQPLTATVLALRAGSLAWRALPALRLTCSPSVTIETVV